MAQEGAPDVGCRTPAMEAKQVIFGAKNLEYQMEQFIRSGGHSVKILLSGKTGVGKSHLTNALIGEELAKEGWNIDPQTDKVTGYQFLKNDVNVTVFDTPGLADATGNDEEYLKKMKEDVSDLDLFLFCTEMNATKFRTDDLETMKKVTMTFGPKIWDHAVVVLTFANKVPLSPSSKTKVMSEENIFVDRFLDFNRKIKDVLIRQLDVPEAAAINVPFVPAGDSGEPRLPDRENWLTAFWVAAFKRINRNAKAAFLLANADRISFSSLSPSDEENAENEENDNGLDSPSAGLSSEEVKAIKEMKKKLKEMSFEKALDRCLLKPRAYDELGEKSLTSQNQVAKVSGPSINVDETSSHDIIKEMIVDVTGPFEKTKFGRYYQIFFKWLIWRFRRLFPAVHAITDKPENERNEDTGEKKESETEDEQQLED